MVAACRTLKKWLSKNVRLHDRWKGRYFEVWQIPWLCWNHTPFLCRTRSRRKNLPTHLGLLFLPLVVQEAVFKFSKVCKENSRFFLLIQRLETIIVTQRQIELRTENLQWKLKPFICREKLSFLVLPLNSRAWFSVLTNINFKNLFIGFASSSPERCHTHNTIRQIFCSVLFTTDHCLFWACSYFCGWKNSRPQSKLASTKARNSYWSHACSRVLLSPESPAKFILCSLKALYVRPDFMEGCS